MFGIYVNNFVSLLAFVVLLLCAVPCESSLDSSQGDFANAVEAFSVLSIWQGNWSKVNGTRNKGDFLVGTGGKALFRMLAVSSQTKSHQGLNWNALKIGVELRDVNTTKGKTLILDMYGVLFDDQVTAFMYSNPYVWYATNTSMVIRSQDLAMARMKMSSEEVDRLFLSRQFLTKQGEQILPGNRVKQAFLAVFHYNSLRNFTAESLLSGTIVGYGVDKNTYTVSASPSMTPHHIRRPGQPPVFPDRFSPADARLILISRHSSI